MPDHPVSRRSFVKTATIASLGLALAACQPIPPIEDAEPAMGQVTAAQVTDPESLKAFVLAAKAEIQAIATNLDEAAKLKQWVKTEGDWKSGSTFLIIFAENGNVYAHGNDRDAENRSLLDVEDERGTKVVEELLAAAAQGGGFVEYYDDGPKTAYAVAFTRRFVLVGGYSQDVSHVNVRIADLPRPAVTASEVVDRETLITFVEEAARIYQESLKFERVSPSSRSRTLSGSKEGTGSQVPSTCLL